MAKILLRLSFVVIILSFIGIGPAHADKFVPLPAVGGNNPHLKIKFVRYAGSTNGQMIVEVKNSSKTARKFSAEGIYFVPEGKPESAPQRLGAAGPFAIISNNKVSAKHIKKLVLKPNETKRLHLEVFCIDSHRSSPSTSTKFTIANKLMPKKMRRTMAKGAAKIIYRNKGNFSASKSAIQSHMWKTRNKKWIKLEGERKNEKAAPNKRNIRHRYRNMRNLRNKSPMPQQRR